MSSASAVNPFAGSWILNPRASAFDANHRPRAGRMRIDVDADGSIVMIAEGVDEKGERCVERPQRLTPDGRVYPVLDFPGLAARTTRPDPNTLQTECRRQDGTLVGAGTFSISDDGSVLTAKTTGWDTQLRQFEQMTKWDRE